MASTTGPGSTATRRPDSSGYVEEPSGYGWVVFAGSMLALVGTLDFIYGIAAISDSKFFVHNVTYVISSLNTWGWVMVCIGSCRSSRPSGSGDRWPEPGGWAS